MFQAKILRTQMCVFFLIVLSGTVLAQKNHFSKVETEKFVNYNYINTTHAPVTLNFARLKKSDLIFSDKPQVCPPLDSLINVITIPIEIANKEDFQINDYVQYQGELGKKVLESDLIDYHYELPFAKGKRYKVIQGFNTNFTHKGKLSAYAIDFKIPVGDTIHAARSGRVIRTDDKFEGHGGKSYRDKANQIIIMHDDGTLAFYVHLDTNGVLIETGDIVQSGDPIGISGFTGYSNMPHLHFVVRNLDTSIPIKFRIEKNLGKKTGKWISH